MSVEPTFKKHILTSVTVQGYVRLAVCLHMKGKHIKLWYKNIYHCHHHFRINRNFLDTKQYYTITKKINLACIETVCYEKTTLRINGVSRVVVVVSNSDNELKTKMCKKLLSPDLKKINKRKPIQMHNQAKT